MDTDGPLLLAAISRADLRNSHGGIVLLRISRRPWPFIALCYADRAYAGPRALPSCRRLSGTKRLGQAGLMTPELASYPGYRFPVEIIIHAVWLYHVFSLSLRDVELILAERGIGVTHESIRNWCLAFGGTFARKLRRRRPKPGDTWHMDEVWILSAKSELSEMAWVWAAVVAVGERYASAGAGGCLAWPNGLSDQNRAARLADELAPDANRRDPE